MKKLENSKKYINYILLLITIIISSIVYWNYLIGHFAAETYAIANNYKSAAINTYLSDGRVFSCILFMLASICNIPILKLVSFSAFIGIIILSIAVLLLKTEITKVLNLKLSQEIIVWTICYCTIFNFIIPEIMYFTESCIIALSILMYILAAKFLNNKKIALGFASMLIAVFCYQGTIGFFVVCCFIFSIMKHKKICKELVFDIMKMILLGMAVAMLNLIFIKILTNSFNLKQYKQFSFNIDNILRNIVVVLSAIPDILTNSCGLFPKNIMLIFVAIIVTFTLIIFIHKKRDILSELILLIIVTILSSCAIFIIQKGSLFTGRVHFCIGSLIGILLLYLYSIDIVRDSKLYANILVIILAVYFITNFANSIQLVTQHQQVNILEKEECEKIQEMIIKHEKTKGKKVTKTVPVIVGRGIEKGFFDQISRKTVITYNNTRHYWCYSGVLNYYLNPKIQQIKQNDETNRKYIEHIKANNMNLGDIVCIDDTLYCPQYII